MQQTLKCASWNMSGANRSGVQYVVKSIQRERPDIISLSEARQSFCISGYTTFQALSPHKSEGETKSWIVRNLLLVMTSLNPVKIKYRGGREDLESLKGQNFVQIQTEEGPITVCGIYNRPRGNEFHIEEMDSQIEFYLNCAGERFIALGDFNQLNPSMGIPQWTPTWTSYQKVCSITDQVRTNLVIVEREYRPSPSDHCIMFSKMLVKTDTPIKRFENRHYLRKLQNEVGDLEEFRKLGKSLNTNEDYKQPMLKVFSEEEYTLNAKSKDKAANALIQRALDMGHQKQVQSIQGFTQKQSNLMFAKMVQARGDGIKLAVKSNTRLKKNERFSLQDLGLENYAGERKGGMWDMLSTKKAPGVDNMLDEIYKDKDRQDDLINYIYDVFNKGKIPHQDELDVKVMLLSKTGKQVVEQLSDIRTICISNVRIKAIEATLRYVTNDVFVNYQGPSQVAFKKGIGDTEIQMVKAIHFMRKWRYVIKNDISNAYDSVDKRLVLKIIEQVIQNLDQSEKRDRKLQIE